MKKETKLKILEFLEDSAQVLGDILFMFSLPHGTSYSRMEYLIEKRHEEAENEAVRGRAICKQTRRNFDVFIYRLKNDGLITKKNRGGNLLFKLTPRGHEFLKNLRSKILPANKYKETKDDFIKIVIFDIPEKERRKRDWLRESLKNLNFKMVQKSVWIGKSKLPKEFIKDIDRINILNYVEIFAITKAGSLRSLKIE